MRGAGCGAGCRLDGRAAAIRDGSGDGSGASSGDGSGDGMPLYKSHKAITCRFKPCISQYHTSIAIYALYSCIKPLYALKSIYT